MKRLLCLIGAFPCLLFFFWVAQDCRLPNLERWLRWPWGWELSGQIMLVTFYAIHSIGVGLCRWFYLVVNGTMVFLAMAMWHHSGVALWSFGPSWLGLACLGVYFVLLFLLAPGQALSMTGVVEHKTYHLKTTGVYGVVRHPMHVLMIGFLALAPTMSLDRLEVLLFSVGYLVVAVPREERRLEVAFGNRYRVYRNRVPAFIPSLVTQRKG